MTTIIQKEENRVVLSPTERAEMTRKRVLAGFTIKSVADQAGLNSYRASAVERGVPQCAESVKRYVETLSKVTNTGALSCLAEA